MANIYEEHNNKLGSLTHSRRDRFNGEETLGAFREGIVPQHNVTHGVLGEGD